VARLVWKHCDGRTTEATMVEIIRKAFNTPTDEAVVQLALEKLAQAGLLETEEHTWLASPTSRRQAVKTLARSGIAAAAALVATIAAPAAAQAASPGQACRNNQDCTTNNCCKIPGGQSGQPGCGVCQARGFHCPNGNC
jgi:Coenzyme PQQ synthesis protein D (PqqD)